MGIIQTGQTSLQNPTPDIVITSGWRINEVQSLINYCLKVTFIDGLTGYVDMKKMIHSSKAGVFEVLRNQNIFNQVFIEHGVVTWPGELDLAPDAMYNEIKQHGTWILSE